MNSLLEKVAAKGETGIILILSRESDIPPFITSVVRMGTARRAGLDDKSRNAILSLPEASGDYHAEVVAELRKESQTRLMFMLEIVFASEGLFWD